VALVPDENGDIKISQIQEIIFTMTPNPNFQVGEVLLDARYLDYITQEKLDDPDTVLPEPPYSVYNDCTSSDGVVFSYHWVKLAVGDIGNHTFDVTFAPVPVEASFLTNPQSGSAEAPVIVQFTDTSQHGPTTWAWDFGDGATSTEQHPVHTFAPGTYNVTLTATNTVTNTSDTSTLEYSAIQPTIDYTASAGPNGSISPSGNLIVDEGSTTTFTVTPDPLYQVADVLIDSTSIGAVTSVTFDSADIADHIITASFEPVPVVASFNASTASGEITTIDEVQFTDTSQGNLSSWAWDFGDGTPVSTEQNPAHTFAQAGDYTVTLTAGNAATSDSYFAVYTVDSSYLSSPVMQEGTSRGYFSLQVAYDDIAGLIETIRMKTGEPMLEDLFFDRDVAVTLQGGYDDTFENVVDFTIINGNVTITFGTVTMSHVIISSL
jgi:PKD repeat protein